jgi:7-cyano-7-deazaguanine reductase
MTPEPSDLPQTESQYSAALSQLGKSTAYADRYDPAQLFPIARAEQRAHIGLKPDAPLPFMGADMWTAFELSWLNARGKPVVAIAHITIPCETPFIVESKSVKLYFNSFNGSRFASAAQVRDAIVRDVGAAVWGSAGQAESDPARRVGVQLVEVDAFAAEGFGALEGVLIDRLDTDCEAYHPAPELLRTVPDEPPVEESLVSHLLKSNCLVTSQPDWGSVQVRYSGTPIDQESLLRYIVSFRNHNEFHEHCVERIFMDIWQRCQPTRLAVYARYTRRGGVDINPFRTSYPQPLPANLRLARQ